MPVPVWLGSALDSTLSRFLPFLRRRSFHSRPQSFAHHPQMEIHILPALTDNYMYLLVDEATREAAIVDPVEPEKVLVAVQQKNVRLSTILTTHHHWDHAGGNEMMVKAAGRALRVIGGDERIPALNHTVQDGDSLTLGSLHIQCIATPCHTTGHICYYVRAESQPVDPAVFTGDTLFIAGCGKFFEGTAEQMHSALITKLSALPNNTRVYCGHEYTASNLRFAQTVEPSNQDLKTKIEWTNAKRALNEPTVPSTIGQEKLINPFMRVTVASVQAHAGTPGDERGTMASLRRQKDHFRA